MIALLAVGLAILALILVLAAFLNEPAPAPLCPRFKCQGPPLGNPFSTSGAPVYNGTLYTNSQGFSLRYYPDEAIFSNAQGASSGAAKGIQITYAFPAAVGGGNGVLIVLGEPASNTTPQAMVQAMINAIAPGAQPVYQLPGALVGYQLGVGEAYDYQPVSSSGSGTTDRVIIMAAIKNGFGIWVVAAGPLLPNVLPNSPFWNGHPSPANVGVAYAADQTVNSIRFPS